MTYASASIATPNALRRTRSAAGSAAVRSRKFASEPLAVQPTSRRRYLPRYRNAAAIRSASAASAWLVPDAMFALSSEAMSIEMRS